MDRIARLWTNGKKKPAISNGFLDFPGLPGIMFWRREGDSNPREGFWPPNRFRVDPVTTTSVSLRIWALFYGIPISLFS